MECLMFLFRLDQHNIFIFKGGLSVPTQENALPCNYQAPTSNGKNVMKLKGIVN